ncbi:hypothetical protein [Desulfovibrio litoralis]|uniref:Lipoprotein-attachment site-containing protein n=1 Tax=Desulfovibrio litoralis DSM 11393 TaxID=1121455 RepID=A0A1M7RR68_9BACT|nr:hypothetical protein [Desulfovibrio litoralis]SHN48795.1 hypothetical protein SAMN02745728_00048 [Desulfovibrio litoralis DSM 11393]
MNKVFAYLKNVLILSVVLSFVVLSACAGSKEQSSPEVKAQGQFEGAGGYSSGSNNSK